MRSLRLLLSCLLAVSVWETQIGRVAAQIPTEITLLSFPDFTCDGLTLRVWGLLTDTNGDAVDDHAASNPVAGFVECVVTRTGGSDSVVVQSDRLLSGRFLAQVEGTVGGPFTVVDRNSLDSQVVCSFIGFTAGGGVFTTADAQEYSASSTAPTSFGTSAAVAMRVNSTVFDYRGPNADPQGNPQYEVVIEVLDPFGNLLHEPSALMHVKATYDDQSNDENIQNAATIGDLDGSGAYYVGLRGPLTAVSGWIDVFYFEGCEGTPVERDDSLVQFFPWPAAPALIPFYFQAPTIIDVTTPADSRCNDLVTISGTMFYNTFTATAPVRGRDVTVTVRDAVNAVADTCTATTNSAGAWSCALTFGEFDATQSVTATFVGETACAHPPAVSCESGYLSASQASAEFAVIRTPTLIGTPSALPWICRDSTAIKHLDAVLLAEGGSQSYVLSSAPLTFDITAPTASTITCSNGAVTTDVSGQGVCELDGVFGFAHNAGSFTYNVAYAGDFCYAPATLASGETVTVHRNPTQIRLLTALNALTSECQGGGFSFDANLVDVNGDTIEGSSLGSVVALSFSTAGPQAYSDTADLDSAGLASFFFPGMELAGAYSLTLSTPRVGTAPEYDAVDGCYDVSQSEVYPATVTGRTTSLAFLGSVTSVSCAETAFFNMSVNAGVNLGSQNISFQVTQDGRLTSTCSARVSDSGVAACLLRDVSTRQRSTSSLHITAAYTSDGCSASQSVASVVSVTALAPTLALGAITPAYYQYKGQLSAAAVAQQYPVTVSYVPSGSVDIPIGAVSVVADFGVVQQAAAAVAGNDFNHDTRVYSAGFPAIPLPVGVTLRAKWADDEGRCPEVPVTPVARALKWNSSLSLNTSAAAATSCGFPIYFHGALSLEGAAAAEPLLAGQTITFTVLDSAAAFLRSCVTTTTSRGEYVSSTCPFSLDAGSYFVTASFAGVTVGSAQSGILSADSPTVAFTIIKSDVQIALETETYAVCGGGGSLLIGAALRARNIDFWPADRTTALSGATVTFDQREASAGSPTALTCEGGAVSSNSEGVAGCRVGQGFITRGDTNYTIGVHYAGNACFNAASATQLIQVSKQASVTTLTLSAASQACTADFDASIFSARVVGAVSGLGVFAGGAVQYNRYGGSAVQTYTGFAITGTNGAATAPSATAVSLAAGDYVVQAVYAGDNCFAGSVSAEAQGAYTITSVTSDVDYTGSTATICGPSTFQFALSGTITGPTVGTVRFTVTGPMSASCDDTVDGTGIVGCIVELTRAGAYQVALEYLPPAGEPFCLEPHVETAFALAVGQLSTTFDLTVETSPPTILSWFGPYPVVQGGVVGDNQGYEAVVTLTPQGSPYSGLDLHGSVFVTVSFNGQEQTTVSGNSYRFIDGFVPVSNEYVGLFAGPNEPVDVVLVAHYVEQNGSCWEEGGFTSSPVTVYFQAATTLALDDVEAPGLCGRDTRVTGTITHQAYSAGVLVAVGTPGLEVTVVVDQANSITCTAYTDLDGFFSCEITLVAAGDYTVTATYSGITLGDPVESGYGSSSDTTPSFTVTRVSTFIEPQLPTAPFVCGGEVVLEAHLFGDDRSPWTAITPADLVFVVDGVLVSCVNGATTLASGYVSCQLPSAVSDALGVGVHPWNVTYDAHDVCVEVTSSDELVFAVEHQPTHVSYTGPTAGSCADTRTTPLTFSANVYDLGNNLLGARAAGATGSFGVFGPAVGSEPATLDGSGVLTADAGRLFGSSGTYTIVTQFHGDTCYGTSSDVEAPSTLVISDVATELAITTTSTVICGVNGEDSQALLLSATISSGAGGEVHFQVAQVAGGNFFTFCDAPITGTTAECTVALYTLGTYNISAIYEGDGCFTRARTSMEDFVVTPGPFDNPLALDHATDSVRAGGDLVIHATIKGAYEGSVFIFTLLNQTGVGTVLATGDIYGVIHNVHGPPLPAMRQLVVQGTGCYGNQMTTGTIEVTVTDCTGAVDPTRRVPNGAGFLAPCHSDPGETHLNKQVCMLACHTGYAAVGWYECNAASIPAVWLPSTYPAPRCVQADIPPVPGCTNAPTTPNHGRFPAQCSNKPLGGTCAMTCEAGWVPTANAVCLGNNQWNIGTCERPLDQRNEDFVDDALDANEHGLGWKCIHVSRTVFMCVPVRPDAVYMAPGVMRLRWAPLGGIGDHPNVASLRALVSYSGGTLYSQFVANAQEDGTVTMHSSAFAIGQAYDVRLVATLTNGNVIYGDSRRIRFKNLGTP